MRIAIDVDDVIIDLMPVWLDAYGRQTGEVLDAKEIRNWDMRKNVKDPVLCYSLLKTPIWQNAKPVRNAGMAVYRMLRAGIDVVYVTASWAESKTQWLIDCGYLNDSDDPRLVVARNKSLINADMIIDDNAETVIRYPKGGIIFARPWNDIKIWPVTVERLDGWLAILDHLKLGRLKNAAV